MSSFPSARLRSTLALAASVALGTTLILGAQAAAASPTACRVRNVETGVVMASLQRAVDAASPGDHLRAKGTCVGTTIIHKNLVVAGVRTPTSGRPTLAGAAAGAREGAVLLIKPAAAVTLRGLRVEGGRPCCGIISKGSLVLRDVVVTANSYMGGGGIGIEGGSVTLKGATVIRGNWSGWGGGAALAAGTRLIMQDSSLITGNKASGDGGGVIVGPGATLVMKHSSAIWGNRTDGQAGGVASFPTSRLVGVLCAPAADANVYGNDPADCVTLPEQ